MDLKVTLPRASSTLSFAFVATLVDRWRERRRPYGLIWAIEVLCDIQMPFTRPVVRHQAEA
jgi:hypothetical protein